MSTNKNVHSQSVATKKPPGVAIRDASKLQLIQRQNSQQNGLGLNQKDISQLQGAGGGSGILSHRSSQVQQPPNGTSGTAGASRNSIIATMRRQQKIQTHQEQPNDFQSALQTAQSCMRDFHVHKKIGAGAYSEVYQVTRKSDGMEYALKQVKIQRLTEKEKENALNEVRILASINNINVIAYKEAFFDEQSSTLCIVMEFAGMGDLYEKIMAHQKSATEFLEREVWEALVQMTSGLKALHDRNIFHRDLKSANIFQSSDGTFKMGDLNVSKIAQDGMLYTQTGTPYYASPEVWQEKPYDKKSDIWSLGCIIYEMCSLNPPFRAKSMKGLYNSVLSGSYPKLPQHYSIELSNIIKSLLAVNPVKRPSCEQLLQNQSIIDFINSRRNSAFSEPMNESERSSIQDVLLKTIHCPRNLSQLSQILPRSKYQSGVAGLAQSISIAHQQNQNAAHGGNAAANPAASLASGSLPVFDLPVQLPAPQTAATDERKGKRRKNTTSNPTAELSTPSGQPQVQTTQQQAIAIQQQQESQNVNAQVGDRNHIIEMAQQIVLPPIRESADGSLSQQHQPPTMLQLQQQRQKELLGIRRKANASNRSKMTIDANVEMRQRPSAQLQKKEMDEIVQYAEQDVHHEKKKMKSQLQVRQQIGRVTQKELQNLKKQSESQSTLLSNYPMEIANTLAAPNLHCLENFATSGNMIEMPPSISNIYATAAAVNESNSRFNSNNQSSGGQPRDISNQQQPYSVPVEYSGPNTSRRANEKQAMDHSLNMMNQPITINDLSQKQKQYQHSKLQRQGSSQHRMQQINEARQSILMGAQQPQQEMSAQQQIYSSQSNLMTATSSKHQKPTPSNASAHRYQSVGMLNGNASNQQNLGSGNALSTTSASNQGAMQPAQQTQGSTSLPGLKLNLQTMKSAKQLHKLTPNDQILNSQKIRQSAKQQQALNENNINLPRQIEKSSSNRNLIGIEHQSHEQLPPQNQQASSHQLPPRQHSTTRNGHGPAQRSQLQSKVLTKQANTPAAHLLTANNHSQRSLQKKTSMVSSSQLIYNQAYEQQQNPDVSSTIATNAHQGNNSPQGDMTQKLGPPQIMTPAGGKQNTLSVSALAKQRPKVQTASQKGLKEIDTAQNTLLMKNAGNPAIQQSSQLPDTLSKLQNVHKKQLRNQASSNSISNRALVGKMSNKGAAGGQDGSLTLSQPQNKAVNREKSQIMVELMPLQGNTGRVNAKLHTGRNNGQFIENFNQKMEQRTTEQESLRVITKDKLDDQEVKASTIAPMALPRMEKGYSNQIKNKRQQASTLNDDKDEEEDYTDPSSPDVPEEKSHYQNNQVQEKRSQLKQLRMQQQSILNKKSRKATLHQDSPNYQKQFTRAHYLEMPHNKSGIANSSSVTESHINIQQPLPPTEINSFEVPKKSHRLLPAHGKVESRIMSGYHVQSNQNAGVGSSQNPALPSLKNYIEDNENISINTRSGGNLANATALQRVDTQQFDRTNQVVKEASGPLSSTNNNVNNSDKSKQETLEQLRQLASIRHQKKQAGMKTQLSVQTKKNGGNKAAEIMTLSAQSAHQSPLSGKIVSQYSQQHQSGASKLKQPKSKNSQQAVQPFSATRSSVPKLPSCLDTRVNPPANMHQSSSGHYDQSN